jgi:hypothetical protein
VLLGKKGGLVCIGRLVKATIGALGGSVKRVGGGTVTGTAGMFGTHGLLSAARLLSSGKRFCEVDAGTFKGVKVEGETNGPLG